MCKLALFVFFALLVPVYAQTRIASTQGVVRYHPGDDAQWADPALDDSQWPIAKDGRVPSSSQNSGGFVWVRMRVPVEKEAQAPLAIHLAGLGGHIAWQVYVNGLSIGGQGTFPPNASPIYLAHSAVPICTAGWAGQPKPGLLIKRHWHWPHRHRSGHSRKRGFAS